MTEVVVNNPFAGSKRHMMSNMFNSPAKPFYQSAISMGLEATATNAGYRVYDYFFSDWLATEY